MITKMFAKLLKKLLKPVITEILVDEGLIKPKNNGIPKHYFIPYGQGFLNVLTNRYYTKDEYKTLFKD